MSKLTIVLGGLLMLNAAIPVLLLTRRSRPHLQQRLFRWVIGGRTAAAKHRPVNSFNVSPSRHH